MLTHENNSQNWKSVTVHITNNIVCGVLVGLEKAAIWMRTSENIFSREKNFFHVSENCVYYFFFFSSLLLTHVFFCHTLFLWETPSQSTILLCLILRACVAAYDSSEMSMCFSFVHKFKCLNIEMHAYHISSLQTTQFYSELQKLWLFYRLKCYKNLLKLPQTI